MIDHLSNVDELRSYVSKGKLVSYHLFWKSHLGQWTKSPFEVEGVLYHTAEHWMMAKKAELFEDDESFELIVNNPSPKQAQSYGRKVKNFDLTKWNNHCQQIVAKGNYHKFLAYPEMRKMLLETKGKVLVEASPYDLVWGIGIGENDPDAKDVYKWRGKNYLGFSLMRTRMMFT